MAYLEDVGYAHDVVISYAWADNHSGWVSDLHKTLKALIDVHLGSHGKLSVWMDESDLKKNELFNESIPLLCQKAAVLICVVSPSYLTSDWCTKERLAFRRGLDERPRDANPHLIPLFKVRFVDVDPKDEPEPLNGLTGYSYFAKIAEKVSENQNLTQQFILRGKDHLDQRFVEQSERLAQGIAETLKQIKQRKKRVEPVSVKRSDPAIYLAEGTDDVESDRYWVAEELSQFKVPILPHEPLPVDYKSFASQVNQSLAQSQCSVHFIGRYYGRRILDDPEKRSIAHLQYDLAVQAGISRIVWMPDTIEEASLSDDAQRQFFDSIKQEQGTGTGLDLLRRHDRQQVKEFIRGRIMPRPAPHETGAGQRSTEGGPVVFVTAHEDDIDRPEVKDILHYCAQAGFDGFASAMTDDAEGREKRDESFIRQANGVVILYASAKTDWVTNRALKVRQAATRRPKNPLVAAVLDSPPPPVEKQPLLLTFKSVEVLNARQGFKPEMLDEFFNQLRTRKPR